MFSENLVFIEYRIGTNLFQKQFANMLKPTSNDTFGLNLASKKKYLPNLKMFWLGVSFTIWLVWKLLTLIYPPCLLTHSPLFWSSTLSLTSTVFLVLCNSKLVFYLPINVCNTTHGYWMGSATTLLGLQSNTWAQPKQVHGVPNMLVDPDRLTNQILWWVLNRFC